MKYLLMIYASEAAEEKIPEAEMKALVEEYRPLTDTLRSSGKFIAGQRLRPATTATSVRVRNGKKLVTDGPFAETKEQLGGFIMVEAKDLDEAVEWASRIPSARHGTIEVRPIWEVNTCAEVAKA